MNKVPVYFMPGLAASSAIFERIELSEVDFETILLEWEIPIDKESLSDYAKRMAQKITHENPVLIGVSFGGILVQEMAKFVNARKVIIISSVKSNQEFPKKIKIAKVSHAYKLLPLNLLLNLENLIQFTFGEKANKKIELYRKFLSVRDIRYLQWAIQNVVSWERIIPDKSVIHIHGDADDVFPIQYIKDCIVVKGGSHIMILNKFKWLNENLPKIILE